MNMISSTIHSEIFIRVVGTFFVLLSVFLMFSFVSFFISWTVDHNIVESSSALDLLKGDKDIKNWGGGIGAFLSYIMIYKTFGIASFGYIFVFIIIGLRLFGIKLKDFGKTILYTFIIMLWLSAIIGFVVYFVNLDDFYELAGVVGISINSWFHSFSGNVGAILILLFFTITLPMMMFGVKYSFINKTVNRVSKQAKEKKLSRKELAKKEYDEATGQDVEESEEEIEEENQKPKKKEIEINPTGITKTQNVDSDGLTEEEKRTTTSIRT